jgi:hypothetical protein
LCLACSKMYRFCSTKKHCPVDVALVTLLNRCNLLFRHLACLFITMTCTLVLPDRSMCKTYSFVLFYFISLFLFFWLVRCCYVVYFSADSIKSFLLASSRKLSPWQQQDIHVFLQQGCQPGGCIVTDRLVRPLD